MIILALCVTAACSTAEDDAGNQSSSTPASDATTPATAASSTSRSSNDPVGARTGGIDSSLSGTAPVPTELTPEVPTAFEPEQIGDAAATADAGDPIPGDVAESASFIESFDGNTGLERFRYGVYHRCVAEHEAGTPMPDGVDNNCGAGGTWSADHDETCDSPDTQRQITSDFEPDPDGSNGWRPKVDFHTDQLLYTCRDHMMDTMGDIAGYSIVWFSPNQVFDSVAEVSFDVNLTDLGTRKWWKVAVVTDELFHSSYKAGYLEVPVPGFLVSEVGTSELNGISGPGLLVATWSGAAGAGYPGAMKVGDTKLGCGYDAGLDKATRHPVLLTDNQDGTVTFSVAGSTCTTPGHFPDGPVRVVFYDHNYNPDKDGTPIGYTFHWDNIVVR